MIMAIAAELAGVNPPGPTDRVSFVPLLEGRHKQQPLRIAMVWPRCTGNWSMSDDWNPTPQPAREQPLHIPDAVLLDEKWDAILLGNTVRLFDTSRSIRE